MLKAFDILALKFLQIKGGKNVLLRGGKRTYYVFENTYNHREMGWKYGAGRSRSYVHLERV